MVHEPTKPKNSSLTLLHDRTLSASVSQVAICPKMDLLAVVLDRVSLAIYRTSWQRLAIINAATKNDSVITCLAWCPDGARLAVGTSGGDLAIYSVDRSAFAANPRAKRAVRDAAGPVATIEGLCSIPTAVTWVLSPLSGRNGQHSNWFCGLYENRSALLHDAGVEESDPTSSGLLFVGDQNGELSIFMDHLQFLLARRQAMPLGCAIQQLYIRTDMKQCFIAGYESGNDKAANVSTAFSMKCLLRAVDLQHILEFWPEIERIGREAIAFNRFIGAVESMCSQVKDEWVNGASTIPTSTIMVPLASLMTTFGEKDKRDPRDALHDIFCGARVNGAILHFLATDLSENGAKEALRSFRGHVDALFEALHTILPDAENSMFRASEYHSLALLKSRYAPVGVWSTSTKELVESSETLFQDLAELCWKIEEVANETEAFLAWLVIAAARSSGESMQGRNSGTLANIEGEDARLVSQYFQTLGKAPLRQGNSGRGDYVSQLYNTRLVPGLEKLSVLGKELVANPCRTISSRMVVNNGVAIPVSRSRRDFDLGPFIAMGQPDADNAVHIRLTTGDGYLVNVRYGSVTSSWAVASCGFLNENLYIHDVAMLGDNRMVFVVRRFAVGDIAEAVVDKKAFELSIHEFDAEDYVHQCIMVDAGEERTLVSLSEATQLKGQRVGSIETGVVEFTGGVSLKMDSCRQGVSVLHSSNRVLVFQLS